MKFTDYPKDLQRIVELTPDGWPIEDYLTVFLCDDRCYFSIDGEPVLDVYNRNQYEQCRVAHQQEQWRIKNAARQNDLPEEFVRDSLEAMQEPRIPYKTRAQRHDNAEDIKAGEVDWRGMCEHLTRELEDIENWFKLHNWTNGTYKSVTLAIKKARTALERTK